MSGFVINNVKARQVLDSRGNPTVEVEISTDKFSARASVPSGASKGKHEALEIRDNGKEFLGKGVRKAVSNVKSVIAPKLIGLDAREQREIDSLLIDLDGTENKSRLGANAILACSMACARLGAICKGVELYEHLGEICNLTPNVMPVPVMNIINGGKHAGNNLDIQEHMIMPVRAKSFLEALRKATEVYHMLKRKIESKYGKHAINVGDEGGYAPPMKSSEEAFEIMAEAIEEAGYGKEIALAFDAAASEFYDGKSYTLAGKSMGSGELLDFYSDLISTFNIISAEDPFAEDDWEGFVEFTRKFGNKIQVVGDDLFVTNVRRLKEGIKRGACNCMLLKINQIGTVSEAIDAAKLAYENGYNVMVSHRSGETCDDFIADLSVAINCGQIKSGAPARGERVAKYNRLIRIEERLTNSSYAQNLKRTVLGSYL
ncbi:MAG: phosphopyruvate hydratase [Thermoplasmata archaeon]|nr:MAG: phosphopyruvate hydratase [Thermoplasmata archaeon]